MFEPIVDLWKQYSSKFAPQWAPDDPRHDLSAEVRERLGQLDLILDHLATSLAVIAIDPLEARREAEWVRNAGPRLAAGEITQDEFMAGFRPKTNEQLRWNEVRLFAEMFYLVAWRLRVVLNGPPPREFPNLQRIEAKSIREVRNLLIEHPEHGSPVPNYTQRLIVTDTGPVLKSSTVVIRVATGRSEPDEDSVDRGLYVNAEEFRRELEACLIETLS